jgi:N-methylhydantoinase A
MEVGGTSTDISIIKNGRCPIRSAEVGGHKLHVSTLDIRTVGLAGGSLVYLKGGRISRVGPARRPRNRALPMPRRRG